MSPLWGQRSLVSGFSWIQIKSLLDDQGYFAERDSGGASRRCQRAPQYDDGFWGEFQGKEASEQHIRELCVGMVSGECPLSHPAHGPAPGAAAPPTPSPILAFTPSPRSLTLHHLPAKPRPELAYRPRSSGSALEGAPPRRVHRGAWCTGDVLNVCSMRWSQGSNNRALSALLASPIHELFKEL